MRSKIPLFFGITVIGALIWYLLIKPHDYVVRFKTKASSGTVNQLIKFWIGQKEDAEFIAQKNLSDFSHNIRFNDSTFIYRWKVEPMNDSISRVKVYVVDSDHSLGNRVTLPFSETDFEKRTKQTIKNAANLLQEHLESFKVTVVSDGEITSKYCACIPLKSTQMQKAAGMMENYSFLSNFIAANKMKLNGRPMIEVENWNMQNDSISYNFCFPILKKDSLPQRENIVYKQIKSQKVLRAIYNGNYITSDRAWYELLEYAEANKIPIEKKPLEIFHTNPNMGGNALEWEADVFMPLKSESTNSHEKNKDL